MRRVFSQHNAQRSHPSTTSNPAMAPFAAFSWCSEIPFISKVGQQPRPANTSPIPHPTIPRLGAVFNCGPRPRTSATMRSSPSKLQKLSPFRRTMSPNARCSNFFRSRSPSAHRAPPSSPPAAPSAPAATPRAIPASPSVLPAPCFARPQSSSFFHWLWQRSRSVPQADFELPCLWGSKPPSPLHRLNVRVHLRFIHSYI
jgi:hypothetical protein